MSQLGCGLELALDSAVLLPLKEIVLHALFSVLKHLTHRSPLEVTEEIKEKRGKRKKQKAQRSLQIGPLFVVMKFPSLKRKIHGHYSTYTLRRTMGGVV